MCGIIGIHSARGPVDPDALRRASEAVSYRGPDASGTHISRDSRTGLAHRRLSIIDLTEGANQPMGDPDGECYIVFNGEVYNFPSLREELEAGGQAFRTRSDTEVLLHAYRRWGRACLGRINGMFAFGVLDERRGRLFLARGRIGKKPLFYASSGGYFVFASELKSVLKTGLVPFAVDPEAMDHYFALGYAPGAMCMVAGVRKLPPGHFLELDLEGGGLQVERFWEPPAFEREKGEADLIEELEALLSDSVRMRLVSEVPLGVFLSGGVDSSLVAALMRRVHNGEIKTFSVGFEKSGSSELGFASEVSRHLGASHAEIIVTPDVREDLVRVSGLMDEPIFDNSLLASYYLARHTKEHVTVALSGDGGDELFGGYTHYASALAARRLSGFAPPPLNRLLRLAAYSMPEGAFGKNTLLGASFGGKRCFSYPLQVFRPEERRMLYKPGVLRVVDLGAPVSYREALMDKSYDFLTGMCHADFRSSLVDDILVKVDRASMFNSLEVRCPILDYRVSEFSFRHVPAGLRIRGGVKKYLLKRLAARYLPAGFDLERKQGFDIPADLLSRAGLPEMLLEFPENEFLSKPYVNGLAAAQKKGRGLLWHKIFSVYFFLRWLETWKG